jgi:chromate transporter
MKEYTVLTALMGAALIAVSIIFFTPKFFLSRQTLDPPVENVVKSNSSLPEVLGTGLKGGLLTLVVLYIHSIHPEDAVVRYGWMSNAQFLDGIALGGILPAPLIIFSTFVGYLVVVGQVRYS